MRYFPTRSWIVFPVWYGEAGLEGWGELEVDSLVWTRRQDAIWLGEKRTVGKGTPVAVALSILIHAGLFLLAGIFVVFTVVKQKEVEFEPSKPTRW